MCAHDQGTGTLPTLSKEAVDAPWSWRDSNPLLTCSACGLARDRFRSAPCAWSPPNHTDRQPHFVPVPRPLRVPSREGESRTPTTGFQSRVLTNKLSSRCAGLTHPYPAWRPGRRSHPLCRSGTRSNPHETLRYHWNVRYCALGRSRTCALRGRSSLLWPLSYESMEPVTRVELAKSSLRVRCSPTTAPPACVPVVGLEPTTSRS